MLEVRTSTYEFGENPIQSITILISICVCVCVSGGAPKTTPRSGDFPGGLAAVSIESYSQLRLLMVKRCLVQSAGGKAHGVKSRETRHKLPRVFS